MLKHGSFNYVIYDEVRDEYFACVGKKKTGKKGYNPQIYYAFLGKGRSNIIMSNDRTLILTLAEEIYKLPDNAYIINGEIKYLLPEFEVIEEEKNKNKLILLKH